jgi:hypothetical protein
MSGEEDLYLNQSEAEALFFPDALLGNADELDFESFGDTSGLDVSFSFRHALCFLVSLGFCARARGRRRPDCPRHCARTRLPLGSLVTCSCSSQGRH